MRVYGPIFACELEPEMVILDGEDELEIVAILHHTPHPYEVAVFGMFDFETYRDRDQVLVKVREEWYRMNVDES